MGIGNMTYAFSSLILRSILGLTEVKVAWVMLAMALCTIAGQLFGGHLADLYGRKKVCVTAFALQISVHLISIFLCRHRIMILLMILASFFTAIGNPVFSAMVSDSMENRISFPTARPPASYSRSFCRLFDAYSPSEMRPKCSQ